MQILVSSILQAPSSVTWYDFDESLALPDEGEQLVEPVKGQLRVERIGDHLLQLTGPFQSRIRLGCDRCGAFFEAPVAFELTEALEVVDTVPSAEEVEETVPLSGYLDVSDLVRQTLLLSLPVRKLCGCEPLVSSSETVSLDPRWSALSSFQPERNGKH
ncbi:MAG: DUF177 domain-containing protein [Candidatus Sericytochromatia bacterium]|nr:DUF177 domain-containing protein [Candidatus Sericytochromatia bacterium]